MALERVFLPWCADEGLIEVRQLDRRAFDRFTAGLLTKTGRCGKPLSRHTVHSYVGPVRLFLTWAETEGEEVAAKPQLPRRPKLHKDAPYSREQIEEMEAAASSDHDKLIIRVFGDCGLRLSELLALEVESIVRSGRQASLAVRGKGDRHRRVPLTPTLLRRLDHHIGRLPKDRSSDRLFLSLRRGVSGRYRAPDGLGREGRRAVADAANRRVWAGLCIHTCYVTHG